jgi:hypothetical protein
MKKVWPPKTASLLVGLCLAAGTLAIPGAGAAGRPAGKLGLASGAYWGMTTNYVGGLSGRESQLGRKVGVHNMFFSWTDHFPGSGQTDDVSNGRIPMVTWEPWNTTLTAIAGGGEDANIVSHAQAMKAFGHPIFLRFAHEMNGNWYPWDGTHNGAESTGTANYIAAWRHVHDIFRAEGATNVVWVWCPNVNDSPGAAWNHWANYYPGDGYVDWVGVDAYNWGTSNGGWRTFASLLGSGIYAGYAATKPIMVAETASNESGGSKAQWIYDLDSALRNDFPGIEAVLWFDKGGTADNWAIDTSAASLTAYTSVGLDAYLGGPGIPGLSAGYFNSMNLTGTPHARADAVINFNWGHGSPMSGVNADGFSVRWTGYVTAPATGTYTFYARTDDGERLWVDSQLILNHWTDHGAVTDTSTPVGLTAGQRYPVEMEYYEDTYSASAQLLWQGPSIAQQTVPARALSH